MEPECLLSSLVDPARLIQDILFQCISLGSILILSSHLHLGIWSCIFPQNFFHQNPVNTYPVPHMCCMSHPSQPTFYHTDQFKPWTIFLQLPVTLSLLGPCIFLSTVFLNTCSLNGRDQVLHLYKTTGKIMLWCVVMCHIWYRNK